MDIKEEIRIKRDRLISLMEENNLKALVLKRHANFSWLTAGGINVLCTAQDTGVTTLLITPKKDYVITSNIEYPRMEIDEEMKKKGFEIVEYPWHEGNENNVIREIVGDLENIGCDITMPPFKDVSSKINRCRYQLLEPEIGRYLNLGERVSDIIEEVACSSHPGLYESEIAGEIARKLWKERIEPIGFQVAADDRVFLYRHPIPKMNPVRKHLLISIMARKWGLVTTITRMVYFGTPSPEYLKQYRDTIRIECEMIAATKPGEKAVTPLNKAVEMYEKLGYKDEWKRHHQGGAMGYFPRDYRVDFNSQEIILENQAFCYNPSIAGTKSEDGFIATSSGPLFITYPKRYPVIELEVGGITFKKPDLLII
ncbi:MAG TPA: M24 family metallopeptidase [Dictyoglomaceae bacterium]|nr:M24 family metallopeptidase [Dictyoglomaceae bacterium]